MTKHWYRVNKKSPYLCDILSMNCIMIPVKDCDACEVYHTWKDNRGTKNADRSKMP